MQIAERLYDKEAKHEEALKECVECYDFEFQDVVYKKYTFKDGSKLMIGENGYIGCELKP